MKSAIWNQNPHGIFPLSNLDIAKPFCSWVTMLDLRLEFCFLRVCCLGSRESGSGTADLFWNETAETETRLCSTWQSFPNVRFDLILVASGPHVFIVHESESYKQENFGHQEIPSVSGFQHQNWGIELPPPDPWSAVPAVCTHRPPVVSLQSNLHSAWEICMWCEHFCCLSPVN